MKIKGKVANIEEIPENNNLIVEAEDTISGKKVHVETELVVLATGIAANTPSIAMNRDKFGFLMAEQKNGILATACAKKPMDVSASVKDATSAALKAIQTIYKGD